MITFVLQQLPVSVLSILKVPYEVCSRLYHSLQKILVELVMTKTITFVQNRGSFDVVLKSMWSVNVNVALLSKLSWNLETD